MKKTISIILTFAYLTGVFQFTVPYLSYYSNYTYFSTEVCINKHNPELECNGQCQLKKMVAEQHSHDASEAGNAIQTEKISSSTIFFYEDLFTKTITLKSTFISQITEKDIYPQIYNAPPTPPPQLG